MNMLSAFKDRTSATIREVAHIRQGSTKRTSPWPSEFIVKLENRAIDTDDGIPVGMVERSDVAIVKIEAPSAVVVCSKAPIGAA
jgi:hypothetical protein